MAIQFFADASPTVTVVTPAVLDPITGAVTTPAVTTSAAPVRCPSRHGMNDVGEVQCELVQGHTGPHGVHIVQVARDGPGEVRGWYDDSPRV